MIAKLIEKIRWSPTVRYIYEVSVALAKPNLRIKELFSDKDQAKETYKFMVWFFVTYMRNPDTAIKWEVIKNMMSQYLELYSQNWWNIKDIVHWGENEINFWEKSLDKA